MRRSLRQESNPHLGRTKGACLPLTLRRRVETAGIEPASARCKRGALAVELRPREVRTSGVEPLQREAAGLQPVGLADAQRPRRKRGVTDRTRTGTARLTTSGARRYTTATMTPVVDAGSTGVGSPTRASENRNRPKSSWLRRSRSRSSDGRAGTTGLEPAASRSTTERSPHLSYAPEGVEAGFASGNRRAETLPSDRLRSQLEPAPRD